VVLVAMFGGLLVLGPWGLVIAPLTVRLAKEALAIAASDSAHAT
jgi:predicted PurR-regulated permease PerM